MDRISKLRKLHNEELGTYCKQFGVDFNSINKLLEAEKTKKLLKRNALIQQNIDREIDNAIDHENK